MPMSGDTQRPTRVLHVINSLGVSGGAEQQLVSNLATFADARLEHHLAYLYEYDFETRVSAVTSHVASIQALFQADEKRSRWRTVRRLDTVVRELRPALIHCSLADASVAARIVGARRRIPVVESLVNIAHDRVRTLDNPNVQTWKLTAHRALDYLTTRRVARFHALSHAVAESWVRSVRLNRDLIEVIPRGLDIAALDTVAAAGPTRAQLNAEFGIPDGQLLLLNVGRLEPQKGQRYLVEAMPAIDKATGGATLLVVGRPGTSAAALTRLVDELGLAESVRFLGRRTDVPALMAACDVFVFPSLYEGLGVSLLEAMGTGCAVAASDVAPLNDVVTEGHDGRLFRAADPVDLARVVIDLASAADRRSLMADAAVTTIQDRFSLPKTAAALEALYLDVLGLGVVPD